VYKCEQCGNTYKFEGIAQERGTAEISRQNKGYSWLYRISDKKWESEFTIKACYFCKSKKIVQI